jgi:peptidoglycan hydrolase-like protein with peptidoglycan-binding domain
VTPATPTVPGAAATGLTAEEQATAQQAGILATPDNFKAFTAAAAALQAEAGAMGPGLNENPEAVNELQQLLKQWGYQVNQTGKFDNDTVAAVLKFKKDNNISYGYVMADGTPGVHPFIDQKTKDVMIKKLGG